MNSETTTATQLQSADKRIPVTLLTGFLGAGKTTLLNHLVHRPEMAGAAVLINEFGEVGIDHHLVDRVDETLMILDSGCLCCSVQGDLLKALRNLADRSSKREIPPVSRVLIETTGLADPVPVIYTLMQEWFVAARYRCDGVITAVDATHAGQQLEVHQEAVRQVAMADRLLITKCDLADASTRAALDSKLDSLNPSAIRIEVRHGRIDPDALFGCGIYTATGKLPDVAAWLGEEQVRSRQSRAAEANAPVAWRRGRKAHTNGHSAGRHDGSVSSFVVEFPSAVPWHGFAVAMGQILETYGPRLLRVKGLMNIVGDPLPRVIHCVQDVAYPPLNLAQWPAQSPFEDHRGRLVFIVRDLPADEAASIQSALSRLSSETATPSRMASCPTPTLCWLSHNIPASGAGNAASAIQAEGWNVQIKGLRKR
ncbi:MAG: GTP-binding protein [Betaproteobacteria bacterium HGW-Betaproteobacteria-12]|nr:MAG: GTP-binding protein [Betaproteobacteria bacterium HGW-Betaproteobacteria-12]